MFAYSWIFTLLLLLAPLFFAVRAIFVCVTVPKAMKREPACERCGYGVAGLTALACPECGVDLRKMGIITPAMELKRRGSLASALVGWTLVIGTLVVVCFGVWGMYFASSGRTRVRNTTPQVTTARFIPVSDSFEAAELIHTRDYSSAAGMNVELVIHGPGGVDARLEASGGGYGSGAWTCRGIGPGDTVIAEARAATAIDIRAVMAAAGVDVSAPSVQAESDELSQILTSQLANPWGAMQFSPAATVFTAKSRTVSGGAPTSSQIDVDTWVYVPMAIFAVNGLVWVGGGIWIFVRRDSLRSMAARWERAAAPARAATTEHPRQDSNLHNPT